MGYDYAYFMAANDGDAGATAERIGGPLGWPTEVGVRKLGWFRREAIVEEPGPAFEGFGISGYDPVMLQALAGLLKPRASNDRRWGLDVTSASAADDFCSVQILPTPSATSSRRRL